ncbi:monovalent cation/H(+) antiporter subunit G [Gulosibacter faecalis]|jgi:multicomponent Na+:H+ antiporter subunit G|uniref:Monovalent cation/H(+) antiporter subunit G n=1 Tax=Gulosibacter faecalis TaxID=272240 RepID=A0ABW5V1L4_9MICO|nr:monovalent cation/H(+) antiporter subunit G [Gulosibacter faecalis]
MNDNGLSGNTWLDLATILFVLAGAVLSFSAGLGLLRFPDLLSRLHAQSKPQAAGLLFILVGLALQQTDAWTIVLLVPIILFQFLTTPAAGMVLARGGYRSRHYEFVELRIDELEDEVKRAQRAEEEEAAREQVELLDDAADASEPETRNPNAPKL